MPSSIDTTSNARGLLETGADRCDWEFPSERSEIRPQAVLPDPFQRDTTLDEAARTTALSSTAPLSPLVPPQDTPPAASGSVSETPRHDPIAGQDSSDPPPDTIAGTLLEQGGHSP